MSGFNRVQVVYKLNQLALLGGRVINVYEFDTQEKRMQWLFNLAPQECDYQMVDAYRVTSQEEEE